MGRAGPAGGWWLLGIAALAAGPVVGACGDFSREGEKSGIADEADADAAGGSPGANEPGSVNEGGEGTAGGEGEGAEGGAGPLPGGSGGGDGGPGLVDGAVIVGADGGRGDGGANGSGDGGTGVADGGHGQTKDAGAGNADGGNPDGGGPSGDILIDVTFKNGGDVPAYVTSTFPNEPGHLGVTILDAAGNVVHTSAGCQTDCDAECMAIACEPPPLEVRRILPGESFSYQWDGTAYTSDVCDAGEWGEVSCARRTQAPPGEYTVQLCYSGLIEPNGLGSGRKRHGGMISEVAVGPVECMKFEAVMQQALTAQFEVSDKTKEWAYCGQAWTYSMFARFGPLQAQYAATEGHTLAVDVGMVPGSGEPDCWDYASMRYQTDAAQRLVGLYHGLMIGELPCPSPPAYVHMIPGLSAGAWLIYAATLTNWAPPEAHADIEACPECLVCAGGPDAEIDQKCVGDCACKDERASCFETCDVPCLSPFDCPEGRVCIPEMSRCAAVSADQCFSDWDCASGELCRKDPAGGPMRCEPDWDDALRVPDELVLPCGCDLECPGAMRCVRPDVNPQLARCAFRCRDGRDCPQGWTCLFESQSGQGGICRRE